MVDHFGDRLVKKIRKTKSFLCLGIDPHLDLIPEIFNENGTFNNIKVVETFCFSLLEAVIGKVPAIKPAIIKTIHLRLKKLKGLVLFLKLQKLKYLNFSLLLSSYKKNIQDLQ